LDVELCPGVDEYFLGELLKEEKGERGTREPKFNRRRDGLRGTTCGLVGYGDLGHRGTGNRKVNVQDEDERKEVILHTER